MSHHPHAPKMVLNVPLNAPEASWWTTAPRDRFTSRCESEWERMRGSRFSHMPQLVDGPTQMSAYDAMKRAAWKKRALGELD